MTCATPSLQEHLSFLPGGAHWGIADWVQIAKKKQYHIVETGCDKLAMKMFTHHQANS